MNVKTVIFPSSCFSDDRPDKDLQGEYADAVETGLFEAVLFSSDKWFYDEKLLLDNIPHEPQYAVYIGWMMTPELFFILLYMPVTPCHNKALLWFLFHHRRAFLSLFVFTDLFTLICYRSIRMIRASPNLSPAFSIMFVWTGSSYPSMQHSAVTLR